GPMGRALFHSAGIYQLALGRYVATKICWIKLFTQNRLEYPSNLGQRELFAQKTVSDDGILSALAQPPDRIINNFSVIKSQPGQTVNGKPRNVCISRSDQRAGKLGHRILRARYTILGDSVGWLTRGFCS